MRLETAFPRAAADRGLLRAEQELRDEGWELAGSTFTRDGQYMLPVYEPPMIDLFDHQVARPRYWIAEHGPVAVQRKGETAQRPGVDGPPRGTWLELGMAVRLAGARARTARA